jgi:predicted nucleic-acid-binding Zn-ribbon protein
MAKKKVVIEEPEYGDEGVVTKDRDLTPDEINDKARYDDLQDDKLYEGEPTQKEPPRRGIVKLKCKCGITSTVSDDVIEDGLSWTMIIGNNHFMTLKCPECESELTLFIEEIDKNELPKESN